MRSFLFLFAILFSTSLMAQEPFFEYNNKNNRPRLTNAGASHFASLALECVHREYPNKLSQLLKDSTWIQSPKELHPAFYGCYDWHSSVHGHWMLVKILKDFPDLPEGDEIRKKLSININAENIKVEVNYLKNESKSWERMYGWAWLLKLAEELHDWDDEDGKRWSESLEPLSEIIVSRYIDFLPKQQYPVRTGVHPNTAFGMSFAHDYAEKVGNKELLELIEERARFYYLNDVDAPTHFEPSGEDFLSASLEEAVLMKKVLKTDFKAWFKKFLPKKKLKFLLKPADVSDRTDPKIVHLDGLNLSRAWSFRILGQNNNKKMRAEFNDYSINHLNATIPHVASENYVGSHWLASFAVYALSR